jgi:Family of unknown function (DUF6503)
MLYRYSIILLIITFGCTKQLTVEEIIDKSVDAYGGQNVYNSSIEFDFRNKHYLARYNNYRYQLQRSFTDSTGNVVDVLNNDGFTRTINDSLVVLDEEWTGKYSRSVNSVVYFFRIPFVLKDEAVKPELIGTSSIKDQNYYKVRVSFAEEGGGEDFDDSFIYWINQDNFYIDYFAYSYSTSGGGKRFREAINPRTVNGLHTVDYINYKPKDLTVAIEDYDQYFLEGGMEELSKIENTNVSIKYLE